MLLLSFLSLLPRLLLGICITHAVWNTLEEKYIFIKIFLAGAVGLGASSLLAFLCLLAGWPLLYYAVAEGIFSLLFFIWILVKNRGLVPAFNWKLYQQSQFFSVWGIILIFGSLLYIASLILVNLQYPHGGMDAWSNWNVVARFIYRGGGDWQNTFLRKFDHPDYPLFMSITNAITWSIAGGDSTWGPSALHFVISIFTAGLLFSLVNALRGFKQSVLAIILFMAQPLTTQNGMSQLADFPLSYIILGAGGLTILYLNTQEKSLAVLAGFLTGLSIWTKNEGAILVISFTAVWSIIGLRYNRFALGNYISGLLPPLLVVILFKIFLAPPNDLLSGKQNIIELIFNVDRYGLIIRQAVIKIWNIGEGPISLTAIAMLYAVIAGKTKTPLNGLWTIETIMVIQLAAYFMIYMTTPHDLEWHLRTSLSRLYLHIFPLALLWFFSWTASPRELSSTKEKQEYAPHP